MALLPFPIVLPFQATAADEDVPTLAVEAAATTTSNALAVANAFCGLVCQRAFGHKPYDIFLKLARVGKPGPAINGPYAYAVGQTNHISLIPLAKEFTEKSISSLRQQIQGLGAGGCEFLLIDAAQIKFSDTTALNSLGLITDSNNNHRHIHIQFFRLSEPNKKIFDIVGLSRLVGVHDTLSEALTACEQALATPSP